MHSPARCCARRRLLALLAAVGLSAAGCVPTIGWLPDSSGILLAEQVKEGVRLVHYDVKTKARRVLLEDTKVNTAWPAVSPHGKRVAVASWRGEKGKKSELQVLLYTLDGKESKRSKTFPWIDWQSDNKEPG